MDAILRGGELWLAGPSTLRIVTQPEEAGEIVGVRFAPGLASRVLRIDPAEVRDAQVLLSDVVGAARAGQIGRALRAQAAAPERNLVIDALSDGSAGDDRWTHAVRRAAIEQRGAGEIARLVGWSERQLRRRMISTFGYGFGALVRIERTRKARALIAQGATLADVANGAGYADQPHMTREFVRLVGRTPGQVAGSVA